MALHRGFPPPMAFSECPVLQEPVIEWERPGGFAAIVAVEDDLWFLKEDRIYVHQNRVFNVHARAANAVIAQPPYAS